MKIQGSNMLMQIVRNMELRQVTPSPLRKIATFLHLWPHGRQKGPPRDFPGGLVVKIHLLMQGLWVRSLLGELVSHTSLGQKTKTWSTSNIVTNSIKTLKMVLIKNLKKKKVLPPKDTSISLSLKPVNILFGKWVITDVIKDLKMRV